MKRDPIVLGEHYILPGSDVGKSRPNANALIVGISGCGKSTSIILPTAGRMEYSNPIINYAKEADGYSMARYLQSKRYDVSILNIANPEKSTISFDPLLSITSDTDVEALVNAIVDSTIIDTVEDYWKLKTKPLLVSLIYATIMISEGIRSPGMADVLDLFDQLLPKESGSSVVTPLDHMFHQLEEADPRCIAVREFNSWHCLPCRTASCVRDTLAAVLSTVFPNSIRNMMRGKPQFDAESFANNKEALIVITNAVEQSQNYYANLFHRDTERQLLCYANSLPNGELPREIRYFFDDFACTSPIQGWATDISLFRSAGLSAIMLLQSEQQLEAIYKEDAPIIRQNCSVYVYFPGGFDDKSCEIVSKRMGLPYDEILYAPMGKVFIMQSGTKPIHIPRYDTLNSIEYQEYLDANKPKRHKVKVRKPMNHEGREHEITHGFCK